MNKAIITGSAGFFGTALTNTLLSRGVRVIGVDTDPQKLDRFCGHSNFIPVVASFEDYETLNELIDETDIDVFYHLALPQLFVTINFR